MSRLSTDAVAPAPAAPARAAGATTDRFRPDIQGLRAVAVLLVVVYHLTPRHLSGGFVGVDVFFVISGYLITRHLVDEIRTTGRLRLWRFWARRARRLLPASLLVLLAGLLMTWWWLPETLWRDTVRQSVASALYVQNWVLAGDAVDYSALDAAPTVAQHYWSLSVEEQFYVVWPLALALLWFVVSRVRRTGREPSVRGAVGLGLVAVLVGSLTWSVVATAADQGAAYFVTPTRLWEFALGGLLSLVWRPGLVPAAGGAVLAWAGIVAVLASGYLMSGDTAFPGWIAAVPVLGTVAVLAGGDSSAVWGPRWLAARPMTFVGDVSYAVYLWHWPLVVVLPVALDRDLDLTLGAGILGLSLVLAWLSTRFLEDPLRRGPLLRPVPAALGFGAVGMAVVVLAAFGLRAALPPSAPVGPSAPIVAGALPTGCTGPSALDPANDCASVMGKGGPRPDAAAVTAQNTTDMPYRDCMAEIGAGPVLDCELGAPLEEATRTVAMVGDSHATAWLPAMDRVGKALGWRVLAWTKASCPMSRGLRVIEGETIADGQSSCAAWVDVVDEALLADESISAVFTASFSTAYSFVPNPDSPARTESAGNDVAVRGFLDQWQEWRDAGLEVIPFADVPRTNGENVPTCVARDGAEACTVPRDVALPDTRSITRAGEVAAAADPGVRPISLVDQFCDATTCYPVVGRTWVYRDFSHLSVEYARALAPWIVRDLVAHR